MGKEVAEKYPVARNTFFEADRALGLPLSRLCFEGPREELTLTENTQPALLATSVAVFRVLQEKGCDADFVAGHSLGEYTALVAAGSLAFEDALRLVRSRGRFMQEAVPVGVGSMAAIIGLDPVVVDAICEEAAGSQVVSPANLNSPNQIAIAGHKEAVERACQLAQAKGARRALPLPVSAPFHCSLMMPAQERMKDLLEATRFEDPRMPLVNNVDARIIRTGGKAREGLIRQISSPVLWTGVVETLSRSGVRTFLEVGPGSVLTGLIRRIVPGAESLNIEKPEQVETHV